MKGNFVIEPSLKPLFAKVLDRFFLCTSRHVATFTDFYDPVKGSAFLNAIEHSNSHLNNVHILSFGGAEDCERRMIGFFPDSFGGKEKPNIKAEENSEKYDNFPIDCLRISYNKKFNQAPRHQDYLGSLLGLGISRERIGDILPSSISPSSNEGFANVFVARELSDYICGQLEKVGRVSVKTEKVVHIENTKAELQEKIINVASLRVDAVVSVIFKLSRNRASELVSGEKVLVNWGIVRDGSKLVKPGDMVTLRGYGRVQIGEVVGVTKKDRMRLTVFL